MISRDLLAELKNNKDTMEAILLWGPRQTGKTTLLSRIPEIKSQIFLDDLQLRNSAQRDPALFLNGYSTPILIDECAYAPLLFPEIKLRIDAKRRDRLLSSKSKKVTSEYYLTGSSKSALDRNIKESLAGRIQILTLSGLSVSEILGAIPEIPLRSILFRGGLPQLYNRLELNPISYLNDYITSYIEKDLAAGEGMGKINDFINFLRLLGGRTGQFINFSEIANATGISVPTIQKWTELLEKNKIITLVSGYSTNLTKRLIKMKKLYFFDTGLAARLQGQNSEETLWSSPQAGSLFETLVFNEIQKIKENHLKDWNIFTWRTKEKEEIDFILETSPGKKILIEVKLAVQNVESWTLGPESKKVFGDKIQKIIVTAGSRKTDLGKNTLQIPIVRLKKFLLEESG